MVFIGYKTSNPPGNGGSSHQQVKRPALSGNHEFIATNRCSFIARKYRD
jgi:hypothetical protein